MKHFWEDMQIEMIGIDEIIDYEGNAMLHPDSQIEELAQGMKEFGFIIPVLLDENNLLIAGHGRKKAAIKAGFSRVSAIRATHLSADQVRAFRIFDNGIARKSQWDLPKLNTELTELGHNKFDLKQTGFTLEDIGTMMLKNHSVFDMTRIPEGERREERSDSNSYDGPPRERDIGYEGPSPGLSVVQPESDVQVDIPRIKLTDRFLVPPFSILDARQGYWQSRKRQWLALGIESHLGRGNNLMQSGENCLFTQGKYEKGKVPAGLVFGEMNMHDGALRSIDGTSIFDPVLCEVAYRWFCPEGGKVLDPFAGGSVRGIVASKLGRYYTGIDLRYEQIEANENQGKKVCESPLPRWICGDSLETIKSLEPGFDMVMSCPPYADLEIYSEDPKDISNMEYESFIKAYREIIRLSIEKLAQDRFAFWVIGEVREKKNGGFYKGLVSDTISGFEDAGAFFYNEAVLITAGGTLAMRVGRQFETSRKIGKSHQNVLVFCKGDPKKATEACGEIEIDPNFFAENTDDSLLEKFGEVVP